MATLVFTVVGTVLGGPIGAAIGATLGNAVDRTLLFAPKGRQGPRLSDLRLQTSSYGTQMPRIHGTMRVAGSVIWSTDLKERRQRHDGGKGQPDVTTYSYSASFAVALSARPVRAVRRIWADGNLLRGAAGDFKSGIGAFRLLTGGEDQPVDPLIGAAVGAGRASAHRGIACALFENLELADFGNRIPSLSFEIEGDAGEVSIGAVAAELSGGAVADAGGPGLLGYAASGGSVADALAPLAQAHGLALREEAGAMRLADAQEGEATPLDEAWLIARAAGRAGEPLRHRRERAASAPRSLVLRHYDPARDYQAGAQRAWRAGPGAGEGERGETALDLPAALAAPRVRALAQERLHALWSGRASLELRCDWRALTLVPGDCLFLASAPGRWRIERSEWEGMAVTLKLRRVAAAAPPGDLPADPGAALAQGDIAHGPSRIVAVDLPPLRDEASHAAPLVAVGAAGASAGWRSAALFVQDAAGGLTDAGGTALPATLGALAGGTMAGGTMAGGSACLIDTISAPVVELAGAHMALLSVDDAALAAGVNAAMIGNELVQFAIAERVGERHFRLRRLWRGRRGTEAAIAAHPPGTPFLLLEEERLALLPAALCPAGAPAEIRAIGRGDATPAAASLTVLARAMRPLAPVHGALATDAAGRQFRWVRRSRAGWRWLDGADAPLGEEREGYAIALRGAGGVFRTDETDAPLWTYPAGQALADAGAGHGGAVQAEIRQLGTFGASDPLILPFTL